MIEVASLRYGVIFKKVFSRPHIFTAFVKDILGIDVEIDKVEIEKSFSPIIGNVDSRFDLFAQDTKNRLIIDIQHRRYQDHYHCVALLEQITNSANYKPDMQVYIIVVLTSDDKHKTDILVTDFRPKKADDTYVTETQHKIIYVCPKYVTDKTPGPCRKWLQVINDSLDRQVEESIHQDDVIQEVFSFIKKDKISPQEYARMKDNYSNEKYMQEQTQKAKNEGIKKGKKDALLTVAKNLKIAGIAMETIVETSGLSMEQIKSL
ncbi:hypothetical protein QUF50_00695 [Thiotrichales bacterium HSG1]|nr:hypothetical protein [Thiotrichales bacterium HSG1]